MWICRLLAENKILEAQSASGSALLQNAINAGQITSADEAEVLEVTDAEYAALTLLSAGATRAAEIKVRLLDIDAEGARAARAVAAGTATNGDTARLANLETEAASLREELAGLSA